MLREFVSNSDRKELNLMAATHALMHTRKEARHRPFLPCLLTTGRHSHQLYLNLPHPHPQPHPCSKFDERVVDLVMRTMDSGSLPTPSHGLDSWVSGQRRYSVYRMPSDTHARAHARTRPAAPVNFVLSDRKTCRPALPRTGRAAGAGRVHPTYRRPLPVSPTHPCP